MIRYALKCRDGHAFESWFQSASAFDTLKARGLVSCGVCGSAEVEKALMAPKVAPARDIADAATGPAERAAGALSTPANPVEAKLREMRARLEREATYVGSRFAAEARAQATDAAPPKPIWGEATLPEAKSLLEDGIAVAPLPFAPKRQLS